MTCNLVLKCFVVITISWQAAANSTTPDGLMSEELFQPFTSTNATQPVFPRVAAIEPETANIWCISCLPEFVGGEEFYQSAVTWTNLACGGSVCNFTYKQAECGPFVCEQCYCDEKCVDYGDCCPDTYIHVTKQPQPVRLNVSCISQAYIPLAKPSTDQSSYKMIAGCPDQASMTDYQRQYQSLCENPNPGDLRGNIPVYSQTTKLDYKNRYCALCHNVNEVIFWEVKPFCLSPLSLIGVSSHQELMEVMRQDDGCGVYFTLPGHHEGRPCNYLDTAIITSCNVTGQWGLYHADIYEACSTFNQPVTVGIDGGTMSFRNIFCASCNGVHLFQEDKCISSISQPSTLPFSFLLNIHEIGERNVHDMLDKDCEKSQIYDYHTASCRPLVCPIGKIPMDHSCLNLLDSVKGLGYIVHAKYKPRGRQYVIVADVEYFIQRLQFYIQDTVQPTEPILIIINTEINFSQVQNSSTLHIYDIDIQFAILVGTMIPRDTAEKSLVSILERSWWWYETGETTSVYLDVWRIPGVSDNRHSAESASLHLYPFGPFDVIRKGTFVYRDFKSFDPIPERFKQNTSEYIEIHQLLLCDMINLNTKDYEKLENGSITIKPTGYILPPKEYFVENGIVRVCAATSAIDQNTLNEGYDKDIMFESWLSIICVSLSLLGLAVTIGLYIYRRRTNTLPGKNSLFLFVNIFLTQLLYMIGTSVNVPQSGCRAFAILTHYFMLASFCWKFICAFHMYWLLVNPLKSVRQTRSFVMYLAFGHLVPLVIIILIVSANAGVSKSKNIGYADRKIINFRYFCFLSSPIDVGLGLLLPIAVVIALNVYFFVRIIHSLVKSDRIRTQSSKSKVKESTMYFKISLLFGFCWILGFLALLINVSGMWALFTVVNGSVGVFIFLCFGLKNISLPRISREETSSEPVTTMSTPRVRQRNIVQDNVTSVDSSPADSPVPAKRETGEK